VARILSVGYLQEFLNKRAELLAGEGHQVVSVRCAEDVIKQLEKQNFDVAIFGHGIPTEDRNLMTGHIKECCASTSVIYLYDKSIKQAEAADAILNVLGAPEDLVNTVKYLAEKKKNGASLRHMAGVIASASAFGGFFFQ
jgi:DNA-binding NtrC family response regulator